MKYWHVRKELEFRAKGFCYYLFIKYYPLRFLIFGGDESATDGVPIFLFTKKKIRACAQVHSIQSQSDTRLLFVLLTPSIILICNTVCDTLMYDQPRGLVVRVSDY